MHLTGTYIHVKIASVEVLLIFTNRATEASKSPMFCCFLDRMICTSGIAQIFSGANLLDDCTTRVTLKQPLKLQSSVVASFEGVSDV